MNQNQNQLPPHSVNAILHGDCIEQLAAIPADCIQCCITSPPYYGLRDYGVAGQIGLERTPQEYITKLVQVFREVWRVLRPDGTLWLNIGDSYTSGGRATHDPGHSTRHPAQPKGTKRPATPLDLKPKDLIGIPWMLAFALRSDGYYLRSDIIWHKPNVMPESVEDRPTTAHEHVFLLAKSERYFYDAEAIKEQASEDTHSRGRACHPKTAPAGSGIKANASFEAAIRQVVPSRNKRSVWSVPTVAYPDAHFATFPPKLVEPCLLAGTSSRACECCGAPWERVLTPTGHLNSREAAHVPGNAATKVDSSGWGPTKIATDVWQSRCACTNRGAGRCLVLDPFMGAGTVALVALQHGRHYLGIEINQDYITMAKRRIARVQPVLWTGAGNANEAEVSA